MLQQQLHIIMQNITQTAVTWCHQVCTELHLFNYICILLIVQGAQDSLYGTSPLPFCPQNNDVR